MDNGSVLMLKGIENNIEVNKLTNKSTLGMDTKPHDNDVVVFSTIENGLVQLDVQIDWLFSPESMITE